MGEAQQALAYSNMELDATGTIILIPQEGLLIEDALVGEELLQAEAPLVCQEPCVEIDSAPQPNASHCLFQGIADVTQKRRNTLSPRIVTRAVKMLWLDELLEQKQIACPIPGCLARFSSMSTVERHYLSCPGVEGSGMEKCPYCDEQFLTLSNALQEHIPEEHPTMKALLHSEAPRKKPPGTYRRRRAPSNNEPPAKKVPPPIPSTREFEVRRRTYSRAWDQPVGPTSELFRRPHQEDDDPLQLPRDCVNQQDITLSSEELALDEHHLAEDGQPSSHDSSLLVLDTASLPRVPLRPAVARPRGNRTTNRRTPRSPAPNSRTLQVIVRSERSNSELLRDPHLLDALGDLATRTEQPQERVAVHAAATAGGRYLQTELAERPVLERHEVDRFFGVVKVDSACQTDDLPPQRPRVSPAILKKAPLRVCGMPAQVAPPPTPAVPTTIPKSIAVSIVCANRGYSSDEDDFSAPVPCPQEAADHALLHLPPSLHYPLTETALVMESQEEYESDHNIESASCCTEPFDSRGGTVVAVTGSSTGHNVDLVTAESSTVNETEPVVDCGLSLHLGSDSTEGTFVQSRMVNPNEKCSDRDPLADSSASPDQRSTACLQEHSAQALNPLVSLTNPIKNGAQKALVPDSLTSLKQNITKGSLEGYLVSNSIQKDTRETQVPANPANPNHDSSEGGTLPGTVSGDMRNDIEDPVVLDPLANQNRDCSKGTSEQDSAAHPKQNDAEEPQLVDALANTNQGSTEYALVQNTVTSKIQNDTEEPVVLDSLANADQGSTEGAIVPDSLHRPVQNDAEEVRVLDGLASQNETTFEQAHLRNTVASSSSATEALLPDSVVSPFHSNSEQVEIESNVTTMEGLSTGHRTSTEDDNLKGISGISADIERNDVQCAVTETVHTKEPETQHTSVHDPSRQDTNTVVYVASNVLNLNLATPVGHCEEDPVTMQLQATLSGSDEESGKSVEHSNESRCQDDTNVGLCLESMVKVQHTVIEPETEPATEPHVTVTSIQPCTELNLAGDTTPAAEATEFAVEDCANGVAEFCDHIDASAQVWVEKMKEKLRTDPEMDSDMQHCDQIVCHEQEVCTKHDVKQPRLSSSRFCSSDEQPVHGQLYAEPSAEPVKGDTCSHSCAEFDPVDAAVSDRSTECNRATAPPVPDTSFGMPSDNIRLGSVASSESEARCEIESSAGCYTLPNNDSTRSRAETQFGEVVPECAVSREGENQAFDSDFLPKACSESETVDKRKGVTDIITCRDSSEPVHEIRGEEGIPVGDPLGCSKHVLSSTSLKSQTLDVEPEVVHITYTAGINTQPVEMNAQSEIDMQHAVQLEMEVDTQPVEIDHQEANTRPLEMDDHSPGMAPGTDDTSLAELHPHVENHLQHVQFDPELEVSSELHANVASHPAGTDLQLVIDTESVDVVSEIDTQPVAAHPIPEISTHSTHANHLSLVTTQCAEEDLQSVMDIQSAQTVPVQAYETPVETDLQSEIDPKSVAVDVEAPAQLKAVDSGQGIESGHVEIVIDIGKQSEVLGTAGDNCPLVVDECEKASESTSREHSMEDLEIGSKAVGKQPPVGSDIPCDKLEPDISQITKENCSGVDRHAGTDSATKGDNEEKPESHTSAVAKVGFKSGNGTERLHKMSALEETTDTPNERREDEKRVEQVMDTVWADDDDDTRSSGEALLHIVESIPDDTVEETNEQHPEEGVHFLGGSGGRVVAASPDRSQVTENTTNVQVECKKVPNKKPSKEPSRTFPRRKPLFQLNLDFPDGAPLKCSACQSIFTEKTLIVEHILHTHYNLARVNDDRAMSDAERRSALLQASKVISRFECKNEGCDASFATYISYYMHHSRCSLGAVPCMGYFTSKHQELSEKEDDQEVPRKKRRSALKAMKTFSSMAEERSSSRGSDVAELSGGSCSTSVSDEAMSDSSFSSGEEESVLQGWRGCYKGPQAIGEKLPEDVMTGWVKGSRCPKEGCLKEFQTLSGLKYHYPRCGQSYRYKCCRCGLSCVKQPWVMVQHLQSCFPDRPKGDLYKKRMTGRMRCKKPFELRKCTVDYREKHHVKEKLYKDWQPSKWRSLSKSEAEQYLPVFRKSPALRMGDKAWSTMELFEASHQGAHTTVFVGGAVWAAAWCPAPEDADQWVAVACCPDPDTEWPLVAVDQLPCTAGLLQIWCLGKLDGPDCSPKPALLLGHDWGLITDMTWCPSGCWEPPGPGHRLGLLALACADGCVRIVSVPHVKPSNDDIVVCGDVVPSVTLESPAGASLCTRLAWDPARGHSMLSAGYGNGMVSVFDLKTTSVLLHGCAPDGSAMLQPCQVMQAHAAAITGLAWNHCTHQAFLASASIDRSAKLWCMNDPAVPVTLFRRGMLRSLSMCQHWNGMFLAGDDTYTNSRVVTVYKENGYFNYIQKSLTSHSCASWMVSASEWLNMAAACDVGGHVSATSLPFLSGNLDSNKKHRNGRVFVYQASMVPLDAGLPTPQDVTSHSVAVEHFGLLFQDAAPNSWGAVHDAKDYTALPNQYHLNSINMVSWNPNGLCWLLSGGQAGIVRVSWLGHLACKRTKPP